MAEEVIITADEVTLGRRDAGRVSVLVSTVGLRGPSGQAGAQGPAGPQGPAGANGALALNVASTSGPDLIDADETLSITDGNIRVVRVNFSALRTKYLDLYRATNTDRIKLLIATPQTYGLNIRNGTISVPGSLGLTWGSTYNWFVPPGYTIYASWKFSQQDDSVPGNWELEWKEFVVIL